MTDHVAGLRDRTTVRVTGSPTAEEVAAVVVALDAAAAQDAAARRRPVRPAWLRAARLEGVGRPVRTRGDLTTP